MVRLIGLMVRNQILCCQSLLLAPQFVVGLKLVIDLGWKFELNPNLGSYLAFVAVRDLRRY